jgi:hypothetical protein
MQPTNQPTNKPTNQPTNQPTENDVLNKHNRSHLAITFRINSTKSVKSKRTTHLNKMKYGTRMAHTVF